jgi:hypothetical protein
MGLQTGLDLSAKQFYNAVMVFCEWGHVDRHADPTPGMV